MLVYKQSAYVQTTKILRIIISEIKISAIQDFSYYLAFFQDSHYLLSMKVD